MTQHGLVERHPDRGDEHREPYRQESSPTALRTPRSALLDLLPHHRVREQARGGLLGLSRRVRERNVDHLDGDRAVVLDAE